ncbi:GNAT family N-acetyltransferase [Agrobacterium sp. Azo12]|uniref:GNAT family N-acetyltransferase n=1 Tax=Agrobacterium sp. Azo12 TaxID=3031129 RepID=UPI0023D89710|nr:GNAT family N-acetyltransferase [Agrobacterium sp. Azo12]MDO5898198.1 GNAT family N-acetyltransferase [Agrobacterium sp. Azo12]
MRLEQGFRTDESFQPISQSVDIVRLRHSLMRSLLSADLKALFGGPFFYARSVQRTQKGDNAMVDQQVINRWRLAPRLNAFTEFFERTASGLEIAFAQDVPAGLMGLKRSQPAMMRHRATLVMVYVRQSLRGSGLASALLQAVEAYARTEDISQIELVLREDNEPARRFYRKRGFAEVGFIPDGFRENDNRFHEILMTRSLEQPQ